jgi:tetratricopeptide (TPR) repeat protein
LRECFVSRGYLAVAKNKYDEAIKYFEKALQIEPKDFVAINNKYESLTTLFILFFSFEIKKKLSKCLIDSIY